MRHSRLPKSSYVRRLEQLYAELSEWRDRYLVAAQVTADRERGARLLRRVEALGEAQDAVANAIYSIDSLERVS